MKLFYIKQNKSFKRWKNKWGGKNETNKKKQKRSENVLEQYEKLKKEYPDSLLLFKSGIFYLSFQTDAIILNKIFNYKINILTNTYKAGFPQSSLDLNLEKLEQKHINYCIIEEKCILKKQNFKHNNYSKYSIDFSLYNRINEIIEKLKNMNTNEISLVLPRIERALNGSC